MILALQVFGLFFGIWFTFVNVGKLMHSQSVSEANFMIMSAAWTLFITTTWLI